jgi:hypothetical protein
MAVAGNRDVRSISSEPHESDPYGKRLPNSAHMRTLRALYAA